MNVIDAAVEKTKSLQGFLLTHSIGGGSGSGLGSLILERLRQALSEEEDLHVLGSSIPSDFRRCCRALQRHPDPSTDQRQR